MPRTSRHLHVLAALFFCCANAAAQQAPYTLLYRQNWQLVNPAAMDKWQFFSNRHNSTWLVNSGYRLQWALPGIEGAPRTFFVSTEYAPGVNGGSNPYNPIRLGFTLMSDQAGAFRTVAGRFNFSYYIQSKREFLHMGLSGGFVQQKLSKEELRFADNATAPAYETDNQIYGDFSFGAFYRRRLRRASNNQLYAGVSVPQALLVNRKPASIYKGVPVYVVVGSFIEAGPTDYSAIGSQRVIIFEPSLWVRYAGGVGFESISSKALQPISVDADFRCYWRDRLWAGIGYGTNQSGRLELGVIPHINDENRLRIGTSFSAPMGRKYLNLGSSVEFTAAYGLK